MILARRRTGLPEAGEISVGDVMRRPEVTPGAATPGTMIEAASPPRSSDVPLIWYLVVSALIFAIGAGGVLVRRNPLVILLCIELMLNAANLALVGFSRVHGNMDGQMFALIVMVVAACEVAVGLGLIVALFRRRLPIDVDELRELQG